MAEQQKIKRANPWLDFVKENRNKDEYKSLSYKELLKVLKEPYNKQKTTSPIKPKIVKPKTIKVEEKVDEKVDDVAEVTEKVAEIEVSEKSTRKRRK